jgi:hypothetical protein
VAHGRCKDATSGTRSNDLRGRWLSGVPLDTYPPALPTDIEDWPGLHAGWFEKDRDLMIRKT